MGNFNLSSRLSNLGVARRRRYMEVQVARVCVRKLVAPVVRGDDTDNAGSDYHVQ